MLITLEGWMTAQVFIKLSSKLAAEQGVVDSLDGAMDLEHDTSSNATHSEATNLNNSDKPRLSRSARRALSAEKKLQNSSMDKFMKSNRTSSSSTV
jgi:hypothetical protein